MSGYVCVHCDAPIHALWYQDEFVRWEENGTNIATCGSSDEGLHEVAFDDDNKET